MKGIHIEEVPWINVTTGVIDTSDNIFYECEIGNHWPTIIVIVKEKYPELYEPFKMFSSQDDKRVYKGINKKYLDLFILKRFKLIGSVRDIVDHINFSMPSLYTEEEINSLILDYLKFKDKLSFQEIYTLLSGIDPIELLIKLNKLEDEEKIISYTNNDLTYYSISM